MDIKTVIKEFVDANLTVADSSTRIEDDLDIFSAGYVNSLFSISLISFLEKRFKIQIDNSELSIDNFNTINNIVHLVDRKVKGS